MKSSPDDGGRGQRIRLIRALTTRSQALEDLDPTLDRGICGRIAEAKMAIFPAKNIAGNDQQLVANGLGHEVAARAPGSFREDVKRPSWLHDFEVSLQRFVQPVAFVPIGRGKRARIDVQGRDPRVLNHAGSADEAELL